MKIIVIGTGYVGLVTGVCFAEMGHYVTCLDIDPKKIKQLQQGKPTIYEPGLNEYMRRNVSAKRLKFSTNYQDLPGNDACFIAVSTPPASDGSCDTSFVEKAAKSVGKYIDRYLLVVNKSTAPVGTCHLVESIIQKEIERRQVEIPFDIVSNPEFLKEGSAISDCMKPDRIIIGCKNEKSRSVMRRIYAPFMFNHEKMIFMDIPSAEMTKYAANAMLATRISFMNQIAALCEKLGANINEVRKGIGSDPRIGYSFLYAGIGYGGSCFPKDVKALIAMGKKLGLSPSLLEEVENVNERQKKRLADLISWYFENRGGLEGKKIGVWGLSFKPETDDIRDAPSLVFIEQLIEKGAILQLYDPIAMENAKNLLENKKNLIWCRDLEEAAKGTDAITLLTEWKQFRMVDFSSIKKVMNHLAFFDGRNQYQPQEMKKNGFEYFAIGLPHSDINNYDRSSNTQETCRRETALLD